MKKAYRIRISGRVQGVFFRTQAKKKAEELGICGFVRNEPDDSVYIEVEGEEKALADFVGWCREGPPFARVEKVMAEGSDVEGFSGFRVVGV